jgi:hypothetical protein
MELQLLHQPLDELADHLCVLAVQQPHCDA